MEKPYEFRVFTWEDTTDYDLLNFEKTKGVIALSLKMAAKNNLPVVIGSFVYEIETETLWYIRQISYSVNWATFWVSTFKNEKEANEHYERLEREQSNISKN